MEGISTSVANRTVWDSRISIFSNSHFIILLQDYSPCSILQSQTCLSLQLYVLPTLPQSLASETLNFLPLIMLCQASTAQCLPAPLLYYSDSSLSSMAHQGYDCHQEISDSSPFPLKDSMWLSSRGAHSCLYFSMS